MNKRNDLKTFQEKTVEELDLWITGNHVREIDPEPPFRLRNWTCLSKDDGPFRFASKEQYLNFAKSLQAYDSLLKKEKKEKWMRILIYFLIGILWMEMFYAWFTIFKDQSKNWISSSRRGNQKG
jgi:hypothetical protein